MSNQSRNSEALDGTELVVTPRDEDARDVRAADRARAESDLRYPAPVPDAMLAGEIPVAAWRKQRGLSQASLADRAGVTQTAISRLERTGGDRPRPIGRRATRQAIARALDVPLAALEPLDD